MLNKHSSQLYGCVYKNARIYGFDKIIWFPVKVNCRHNMLMSYISCMLTRTLLQTCTVKAEINKVNKHSIQAATKY